nr:hypothetical protein [Streptomyces thermoviolaceus]
MIDRELAMPRTTVSAGRDRMISVSRSSGTRISPAVFSTRARCSGAMRGSPRRSAWKNAARRSWARCSPLPRPPSSGRSAPRRIGSAICAARCSSASRRSMRSVSDRKSSSCRS